MKSKEIENIKKAGFIGFIRVSKLRGNTAVVPECGGVYIVIRESDDAPQFHKVGTGGYFKNMNPNVSIEELEANYVANSKVLYIGQSTNLKKRVNQLLQFGAGNNVGHWGGRYLWQLADAENLIIAWKPTPDAEPREVEKRMFADFKIIHGKLPFANLSE